MTYFLQSFFILLTLLLSSKVIVYAAQPSITAESASLNKTISVVCPDTAIDSSTAPKRLVEKYYGPDQQYMKVYRIAVETGKKYTLMVKHPIDGVSKNIYITGVNPLTDYTFSIANNSYGFIVYNQQPNEYAKVKYENFEIAQNSETNYLYVVAVFKSKGSPIEFTVHDPALSEADIKKPVKGFIIGRVWSNPIGLMKVSGENESQTQSTQIASSNSWSGKWITEMDTSRATLILTQDGSRVTGRLYKGTAGSEGSLDGSIIGGVLKGKWKESELSSAASGDFEIEMSQDGNSFAGKYGSDLYYAKGSLKYVWTGNRDSATVKNSDTGGKNDSESVLIEAEDEMESNIRPLSERPASNTKEIHPPWRPPYSGTGVWYLAAEGESLKYQFNVHKEGIYHMWVRDYVDRFQPKGVRRIIIEFDGGPYGVFSEVDLSANGDKGAFGWHRVGNGIKLSYGTHILKVTKEATTAGAAILDAFYLTTDPDDKPAEK